MPKAFVIAALALLTFAAARVNAAIEPAELTLAVGEGRLLKSAGATPGLASGATKGWTSTDPAVAVVYKNGFVVALKPGQAAVRLGNDVCRVRVVAGDKKRSRFRRSSSSRTTASSSPTAASASARS